MQVRGLNVVVTGGTDGIGRHLAAQLHDAGAAVIVIGRDGERLAAARAAGMEAIAADLSNRAGCDALIVALAGRPIDMLINNAGMNSDFDVDGVMDRDMADRAIFLNLHAPIHLVAGLLPALRARPQAAIVNVTSGLAYAPRAGAPVYCATKAGLRSFTQTLRHQLRDSRIRVIEVLPPVVDTRMTAANRHRKMPADACARDIIAAIRADRLEAPVGAARLLRILANIAPAAARRIMIGY